MLPGTSLHLIQRGNNRQACFFSESDYLVYLEWLEKYAKEHECLVHAYVLMTNHVHLLVTPLKEESAGLMMKQLGQRYVQYINRTYRRSGTLWEGRYKSSLIDKGEYLLACCRYVEMNPVRAGAVLCPEDYRWSSYRAKAGLVKEDWLDYHPLYLGLAKSEKTRQGHYRKWMTEAISDEEEELIRQAARRNQLTGGSRFVDEVEKKLGKRVELRGRGRPRKIFK